MFNILQYYKIEKTEEDKEFFFNNLGYFNFWDEYLIANMRTSNKKLFWVIVNRTRRKFNMNQKVSSKQIEDIYCELSESIRKKKPEEMFADFPELISIKIERISK